MNYCASLFDIKSSRAKYQSYVYNYFLPDAFPTCVHASLLMIKALQCTYPYLLKCVPSGVLQADVTWFNPIEGCAKCNNTPGIPRIIIYEVATCLIFDSNQFQGTNTKERNMTKKIWTLRCQKYAEKKEIISLVVLHVRLHRDYAAA